MDKHLRSGVADLARLGDEYEGVRDGEFPIVDDGIVRPSDDGRCGPGEHGRRISTGHLECCGAGDKDRLSLAW